MTSFLLFGKGGYTNANGIYIYMHIYGIDFVREYNLVNFLLREE